MSHPSDDCLLCAQEDYLQACVAILIVYRLQPTFIVSVTNVTFGTLGDAVGDVMSTCRHCMQCTIWCCNTIVCITGSGSTGTGTGTSPHILV